MKNDSIIIQDLASLLHGQYVGIDAKATLPIEGAVVDSRKAFPDSIFFCIQGNAFDGHQYIEEAYKGGACLAIVERDIESPIPYIRVDNTIHALGLFAKHKRNLYEHLVIAITGSAGKTTAKEILYHILSTQGIVSKNFLNYNNQIGMPLAILNADINAIAWILEIGISESHDMQELGVIAEPDIVYITNAGNAHTEGLGDKGVAYHKASLMQYVSRKNSSFLDQSIESCAFIPEQYTELYKAASQYDVPIHGINDNDPIDVVFNGVVGNANEGLFTIQYKDASFSITIPYTGYFMQETLSAVIQISLYLGLDCERICQSLCNLPRIEQRNSVVCHNGSYVIDDTYNANPISMQAMIETTYSYPVDHYILLLGDMKELGSVTEKEHIALGAYIANKSKTAKTSVLWKGEYGSYVKEGLFSHGFTGLYIKASREYIESTIADSASFVILCKGSRSVCLEQELQEVYSILGVYPRDI